MIDLVLLPIPDQDQLRPLFDTQGVQASLLLVLEDRATTDRDLLQGSETGCDEAGQEDNEQHRDQSNARLTIDNGVSPAMAAGG